MNEYWYKQVSAVFIGVLAAFLLGCSDSKEQKSQEEGQAAPASQNQVPESQSPELLSAPTVVGGYKMMESFNVGDNVYVRSLAIDKSKNSIWVGTSLGVLEVDLKTRNMLGTYTRTHGLANEYVFGMMVDSEGKKWFGTNGGGITTHKDNNWKTYFPMHGLADYWVYSFTQQTNGTIWAGTWAGLSRIDPKTGKFRTYLTELVNEWVYGLGVDSKDRVWIGTEGGINMFDGKNWATWTHKDGLGAPNKDNLPISDNTGLGTRARHDLNVTNQGMPTYNPNYVFSLAVAKDDVVWAGTWGGGVSRFDGKNWQNFTKEQGVAGNIIYSVAVGNNGDMWFGTNEGLSRFDGKNWYNFTRKEGLLDNNVYAIAVTANDQVWVGSKSGVVLLAKQ